ncbi:MAG: TerC family protein [Desulfomonile sp.]|jgi:YjbE family integral membrane protein
MNLESLAFPGLSWDFAVGVLQIIMIDLILAGDNAVVIALAVKTLPKEKRLMGIAFGAGFAVFLRVTLTFFAAQLLIIPYVKLLGGVLIFWIACKLLLEDVYDDETGREAHSIWGAIWIIVVADVTMSTDNILALAGASKGSLFLLIFGLVLSIPLVVGGSTILARLMDRYPIIIYVGAAVLGKVSAEMIFTDPAVEAWFKTPEIALYVLEAFFAAGVIGVAKLYAWALVNRREV